MHDARQKMDDYKPLATKQEGTAWVEPYQGTEIFINSRLQSWQAHLERTSIWKEQAHFYNTGKTHGGKKHMVGRHTWWEETHGGKRHGGKRQATQTQATQTQMPVLMHFRSSTLPEVQVNSHKAWQHIVDNKIPLPTSTSSIRVYDGKC